MLAYVLKKGMIAIVVLFTVSVVVFGALRLTPSDPVSLIVGVTATQEARDRVTKELRLDRPVVVQYGYFLKDALRGYFGTSYQLRRDVAELIGERLLNTLKLGATAMAISYLIAIPLGVVAAVHRGTWIDRLATSIAYAGVSIPNFVVAVVLILVFAYKLGWFPTSGYTSPKHLVLPAAVLAFEGLCVSVRIVRTSMLEVLGADFIRTLRAKGLPESRVIWQHALKNSLVSVISVFAMRLGWLLGGSVAIEVIFAWPGAGRLLVDAVSRRDYPIVQALTLVLSTGVILSNLLADILYAAVNPRIRY